MKVCCEFRNGNGYRKLIPGNFELVKELYDSDRHSHCLMRCRRCGCLVLERIEETAFFLSGYNWDKTYVDYFWYPVESLEEAEELENKYVFGPVRDGRPEIQFAGDYE